MRQIIGLTLTLVAVMACVTLASRFQSTQAQAPAYLSSFYGSGASRVTITRSGQVLSVLEVPAGVAFSMHLSKGEFTKPDEKTGIVTFNGDVSIRTRPRSELAQGALLGQMMNAPVRLDVKDAVVVALRDKK